MTPRRGARAVEGNRLENGRGSQGHRGFESHPLRHCRHRPLPPRTESFMKICFLMYQGNMYSGGQGVYLHYLTRELARVGHEVHVIAGPPYPMLDESVRVHRITDYSYWTYHHYKKEW